MRWLAKFKKLTRLTSLKKFAKLKNFTKFPKFKNSGKELKRLARLLEQYRSTEHTWHKRAMDALKKQQEDLARQAIVHKLRAQKGAALIESQIQRLTTGKLKLATVIPETDGEESWIQLENMVRMNKELITSQ